MTLFPRTRARLRNIAWRLGYTGRVLERTTYSASEAYEQAKLAQSIYATTWDAMHPVKVADHRLSLTCPADKFRARQPKDIGDA